MKPLILSLALLTTTAHAEFMDGNRLLSRLNGTSMDGMLALGYMMGVFDSLYNVSHCPPSNVTAGQVNDMVKNYLDNTPAIRHHTADAIVSNVLKIAWPCPDRRNRGTNL